MITKTISVSKSGVKAEMVVQEGPKSRTFHVMKKNGIWCYQDTIFTIKDGWCKVSVPLTEFKF